MTIYKYWSSACPQCALRSTCTFSDYRRIGRWQHEHVLDAMQARLYQDPTRMQARRQTAEHPLATIPSWMGATHVLSRTLPLVSAEMGLHVDHGDRAADRGAPRLIGEAPFPSKALRVQSHLSPPSP